MRKYVKNAWKYKIYASKNVQKKKIINRKELNLMEMNKNSDKQADQEKKGYI